MKLLTFAGVLAGLVALSLAIKKTASQPVPLTKNPDQRYAIDELISEQEL